MGHPGLKKSLKAESRWAGPGLMITAVGGHRLGGVGQHGPHGE